MVWSAASKSRTLPSNECTGVRDCAAARLPNASSRTRNNLNSSRDIAAKARDAGRGCQFLVNGERAGLTPQTASSRSWWKKLDHGWTRMNTDSKH